MTSDIPIRIPGAPVVLFRRHDGACHAEALVDRLYAEQAVVVWLDSARAQGSTGRYSLIGWDPWLTMCSRGPSTTLTLGSSTTTWRGNPFDALGRVLAAFRMPVSPLPIGAGLLVALSYELGGWIERLPDPKPSPTPLAPELLAFGMRQLVVVDHAQSRYWAVSVAAPTQPPQCARRQARAGLERVEAMLHAGMGALPEPTRQWSIALEPGLSQPAFEAMVRRAQECIAAGEIFQANLSHRLAGCWDGSPWALYRQLRRINPSSFACFVSAPELAIVSCSPERLVQAKDGIVTARPIAGTRPRGSAPEEELLHSVELILSDKERAEHIMLVDLARNDLGKVCRYGSVRADELMSLEAYSHVIHLVSNVVGRLRDGAGPVDVIRAVFPGGTITGCPKVRSMEIIHDLEPVGRGFYTGSCGYLGFDGSLDLNILIRTLVIAQAQAWLHVGAGIVADSQPDREYEETLAKAGALLAALEHEAPQLLDSSCR